MRVPLSIFGRGWPIRHFLSWPRVVCSPYCLQTPRHLSTFMSLLMWCHFLNALLTLPKLALLKSAYHQYLKQEFFSFFPRALSPTPLSHSLGKPRLPVPAGYLTLCGAQSPRKSALHCISVSICRLSLLLLWVPNGQEPLTKLRLSARHHLGPWTYWWPGSQEPGCMHFS